MSKSALQDECVQQHNAYRSKHGCPPLEHHEKLSVCATEWANKLIKKSELQHRPNNKYGENIFTSFNSNVKEAAKVGAKEACKAWYDEIKDFKFGREPKTLVSGHFTQLIWKKTQRVGIGKAQDGKGRIIIVCNYDPPGNVVGQYTENCPSPS